MAIDGKYYGTLRKISDSAALPDDWVVFRAKDNAFWATLPVYRQNCVELGSPPEQIAEIDLLIERVRAEREAHPLLCKAPD